MDDLDCRLSDVPRWHGSGDMGRSREGDLAPPHSALNRAVVPGAPSGSARDEHVVRKVLDTLAARDSLRPGREPTGRP